MNSQYYKVTAYVGTPHRNAVEVTIPLVGPQGPAGEGGGGDVESVNGQTGVVVLAAADVGAVASNDARLTDARTPTSHTHGNLTNAGAIGTTSGLPVKTGTSGVLEAGAFGTAAGQFAEGNHTHTPASLGAAQAVTVIELTPSPGSTTITTSQLPARGIAFIEGGGSFTVNLPTPDKRESGLTFSIKVEHEGASGDVFITVVHNASDLLTSYELDEDESSLDFLWDGYRWTYSSANWLYSYPNRRLVIPPLSGTLGLSEPSDSTFRIVGSSDATKKVAFEVDGLTTATTRTLTVPNASGTLALLETLPAGGSTNLWIPASAWIPRTTGGCGVDSREIGSTNRQNFDELLFDAGTDEFAQALVIMPSNYNNSTITARFYWTAASGSGDVIWGLQGRAFANDDALDTAHGTAQTATDTLLASNDMHVSAATSAVTIGGTPAANTPIQFQVYRDADAGGDTLAVDARLLGVEIIFN